MECYGARVDDAVFFPFIGIAVRGRFCCISGLPSLSLFLISSNLRQNNYPNGKPTQNILRNSLVDILTFFPHGICVVRSVKLANRLRSFTYTIWQTNQHNVCAYTEK
ncbi:hypothetical protein POVWA2_009530 [Plasmodium ovale wallikeri]|uniref:Uncharacterized protein n=1 Tax=Plasmodium ovale wallikeri TaxID=864142 RepID=A0A1A8YK58_PLAOA|nr:hypothetical protein POVWA1_009520 [Plasmodium ovale wallikeri]SBT32433.1 hypothetical protein POVWA2_009530 [Plasmodium ovale wallikeri]